MLPCTDPGFVLLWKPNLLKKNSLNHLVQGNQLGFVLKCCFKVEFITRSLGFPVPSSWHFLQGLGAAYESFCGWANSSPSPASRGWEIHVGPCVFSFGWQNPTVELGRGHSLRGSDFFVYSGYTLFGQCNSSKTVPSAQAQFSLVLSHGHGIQSLVYWFSWHCLSMDLLPQLSWTIRCCMSFKKATKQQSNSLLPSPAFPLQLFLMNSSSSSDSPSSCTEQSGKISATRQPVKICSSWVVQDFPAREGGSQGIVQWWICDLSTCTGEESLQ